MISVIFKNTILSNTNLILINWKIEMHSMATNSTLDGDMTDNGQYTRLLYYQNSFYFNFVL